MACARGDQYLVQLLLDGRGSMRAMIVADMDGYTPLHVVSSLTSSQAKNYYFIAYTRLCV